MWWCIKICIECWFGTTCILIEIEIEIKEDYVKDNMHVTKSSWWNVIFKKEIEEKLDIGHHDCHVAYHMV